MAVICFADGGCGGAGRVAAGLVEAEMVSTGTATTIYHYSQPLGADHANTMRPAISGRQFIQDIQRLKSLYPNVIIDISDAPDHTAALAFGLADLTLIPLRPHDFEPAAIIRTVDLLEILSAHRRKSLRYAVFLAGDAETLKPSVHMQISGLLIRRGVATLPVSLREQGAEGHIDIRLPNIAVPRTRGGTLRMESDISSRAFAQGVLSHLADEGAASLTSIASVA